MSNPTNNAQVKAVVSTITPAYAELLLKKNNNNRPINRLTVLDYKNQMTKGLWKMNGEPIIISKNGNLIDGQHRLLAVYESGITIESLIVTGVDDELFATIDTGRVRTSADMFQIEDIPNAAQKSAIVSFYYNLKQNNTSATTRSNLRRLKTSRRELLDFYKDNSALVDQAYSTASRCYRRLPLMKISEIGSMIVYLQKELGHSRIKVESFFEELFDLAPVSNQTIKLLRDILTKYLLGKIVLTPQLRKSYIIKTWNYYATGREVKSLSYNKEREGFIHLV